jgi:hypothetical protein
VIAESAADRAADVRSVFLCQTASGLFVTGSKLLDQLAETVARFFHEKLHGDPASESLQKRSRIIRVRAVELQAASED